MSYITKIYTFLANTSIRAWIEKVFNHDKILCVVTFETKRLEFLERLSITPNMFLYMIVHFTL